MASREQKHLQHLLNAFDAASLGEGDHIAGANTLAAMLVTLANFARPGSGIMTKEGRLVPVGCDLLASGPLVASMIHDDVVTPLSRCMHTMRGITLSVAGLAWCGLGFDPGCPRRDASRVLGYLRDKGSMTKSELLRRTHLDKELRDTLVGRFAAEGLVRVDGKTVTATSYREFVEARYAREGLPQPVDLWPEIAGKGESLFFGHLAGTKP